MRAGVKRKELIYIFPSKTSVLRKMDPNKITCVECNKKFLGKNAARHKTTSSRTQQRPIEPQKPCVNCGTLVTLSHGSRHLKNWSKNVPVTNPYQPRKKQRADTAVQSTSTGQISLLDTVRASVASAFHSLTSVNRTPTTLKIREIEKAFKNKTKTYIIEPNTKDPKVFIENARHLILDKN